MVGVHFDDTYHINSYDIILSMLIETEIPKEHNIAMDRLDFFVKNIINNSVFVHQNNSKAIENYLKAGIEVITLPGEPYDQIVAMALLLKFNSIMENRIKITDITITSLLSAGIRYPIVSETAENADIMIGNNWWNSSDTKIRNQTVFSLDTDNNVVKLFDDSDWANLNLSWKDKPKSLLT
jgi:hypothetical protein